MPKTFNTIGVCIPDKHYMVDLTEQIDKITNFHSNLSFVNMFLKNTAKRLAQMDLEKHLLAEWGAPLLEEPVSGKAFDILSDRITALCGSARKDVLLLIDEVDKCSNNQVFLNFLGMLRNKYLDMQEELDTSFYSVILAGVYDIKNLKLKFRSEDERRYNSPWNIAVDFRIEMSFSPDDIAGMLGEYSVQTKIPMDCKNLSARIFFYTGGYPFLASWICKWIDEHGRNWTEQGIDLAVKELLRSDNTLFDDLFKNIENNHGLYQMVTGILFDSLKVPFVKSDPIISLGIMFGLLAEREGAVTIANVIFETFLYNHIVAGKIREQYAFRIETSQFIDGGRLDMEKALQKFQEIMKAEYRNEETYIQNTVILEKSGRQIYEITV